jgi:beta-galactosidase
MRRIAGLLLLVMAMLCPAEALAAPRQSVTLSSGWRFLKEDVAGAEQPTFDDSKWTKVTLPHSFNASEGDEGTYYRGPAWYRRTIEVAARSPGRRMAIQFDGAATAADVYLNGNKIGRHEGGHAAFRFDITDALVVGKNLLAVRVDNSPSKVISPLGGDFTLFGGLYRPVKLIETDAVHLDLFNYAGPGVNATARELTPSLATVAIEARVANDEAKTRRVQLLSRILDASGKEVARERRSLILPAHSVRIVNFTTRLASPHLWDGVRDPYLYSVVTRIGGGGDEVSIPLGIRTFRIDPEQGFVLNGKPYHLHGANLQHPARPGKGTAISDDEVAEDFRILREMGSTALRLAHFQHPTKSYDEADRLGLGLWTEIGINSDVEDTPEFRANAAQQLRELIAQTRNHPSIFLWGIGNEIYPDGPKAARILTFLQGVAKDADPSRPTVYAHCCQADDDPRALVTDVIAFNRYFGWYGDKQNRTMDSWARSYHRLLPKRAFAVSEYGAGASIHQQADPPGTVETTAGWHPEQYQTLYHEKNWRELRDKPYIFATFVWVAFDFASAGRHEGDHRGINDKGLVTYDRQTRKDAYYWYQANWSDKPMLYITSRRFTMRPQADVEVKAYTNAGPATLFLNGRPVTTAEAQDHILRWKVRLQPGPNNIEVRSALAPSLTDTVNWSLAPQPSMLVPDARP